MAKRKKRKSSREAAPEHELPGGFWRQAGAVVLLALAVVLVMTWFGSGGTVLNNIHNGALYLIGYAAYFIPILLVYLAISIFRAEGNRLPIVIWIASFLMVAWLSGIFGIPTFGQESPTGGIVGEGLNSVMTQILDKTVVVFIYVVLIFITGIFILAISPASVFRWIGSFFRGSRREEDTENARIAREARDTDDVRVPIRGGISRAVLEADKENRKLNIKRPTPEAKAPEPAKEKEGALVAVSDPDWKMPSTDLLSKKTNPPDGGNVQQNAAIIRQTYEQFGINVEIDGAKIGPRVTQYALKPPAGINLGKITARDKELAMNLAVDKIRIEAPIPGTNLVGVELPNARPEGVTLRSLLESPAWKNADKPLTFVVGKDISGNPVMANLAKMPHLLIAGTTGSGKSVMTNILISSLLYRNAPSDLKLIIVDPKQVEMVQYDGIPHLLTPIINSTDKALSAMKWAVNEMERRYSQMASEHVKNIEDYNAKIAMKSAAVKDEDGNEQQHDGAKMPYIVVIIDEMADLMMQAGKDLESPIVRIAQKGRAAGMHLVLATQRPVVKVITGLIKSNVPGRIAFAVNNNQDSRIMLDMGGAEKLLGSGDMLMLTTEMMGKPRRIQGAFASDSEIEKLTNFLREQRAPEYNDEVIAQAVDTSGAGGVGELGRKYDPNDPMVRKAVEITLQQGKFSTSSLQTYLGKGHGFVSGLAIWLEGIGVIGPPQGTKPREINISTMEEFDELANQ
ncbi:DNA translocase FtsK 4TM domain-containing protein [Candidatus Saccharibacteria bacterium]|nr:DNA translocase FtsK 4TM domain-containing protein [Candidatus Saccharibacteria bacterium]